MKKCPYCGKEYSDDVMACLVDQQSLGEYERDPQPDAATANDITWRIHVLLPAVLWLAVNFALLFSLGLFANMIFNLVTATWASVDCSKMQSHGSKVLGIAFKPVVVFALCAFLMWGFGFIWYLVLRRTVKDAPVITEDLSQGVSEAKVS